MTFLRLMSGLGDSIYQRPFARQATHIETAWPQLFADLPCKPVRMDSKFRCQTKNIDRYTGWVTRPEGEPIRLWYSGTQLACGNITRALESAMPLREFVFDLPPAPPPVPGRYAVVRPVTRRTEWDHEARACRPEYVAEAARLLRRRGITVVSVADLAPGVEWIVGDPPEADITFHAGELDPLALMGLIQHAAGVVGGVGWIVPAAIAARVSALFVLGGNGAWNGPAKLTDQRMDLSRVTWARPDRFCGCAKMQHDCDKTISGFADIAAAWVEGL